MKKFYNFGASSFVGIARDWTMYAKLEDPEIKVSFI